MKYLTLAVFSAGLMGQEKAPQIDPKLQIQLRTVERDMAEIQLNLTQAQLFRDSLRKQVIALCGDKHEPMDNPKTGEISCQPKPEAAKPSK